MKSSHHIDISRHVITHSAVSPVIPVASPDRIDWHEPNLLANERPEPEPTMADAGLYTDLQSARVFAEQMRELIALYRALYGEFYIRPQPRN